MDDIVASDVPRKPTCERPTERVELNLTTEVPVRYTVVAYRNTNRRLQPSSPVVVGGHDVHFDLRPRQAASHCPGHRRRSTSKRAEGRNNVEYPH